MQSIPFLNSIRVDIEGRSPIAVLERLQEHVNEVINVSMKCLNFSVRMAHSTGKSAFGSPVQWIQRQLTESDATSQLGMTFLSLEKVRQCVKSRQHFVDDEGNTLLTLDNLQDKYKGWMKSFGTLEKYDVFLSYRQSPVDSPLVAAVFDRFSLFNITTSQRAIEVLSLCIIVIISLHISKIDKV